MNIELDLHLPGWKHSSNGKLSVLGTIEDQAASQDLDEFESVLASANNESMDAWLAGSNGFFALIHQQANRTVVSVDRVRSRPMFYAQHEQTLLISDIAETLRRRLGLTRTIASRVDEFTRAGYVTGGHTLFEQISQLSAGSRLCWRNDIKRTIELRRWYEFRPSELQNNAIPISEPIIEPKTTASTTGALPAKTETEAEGWRNLFDRVSLDIVQRLIKHADGRQIVIPLSGGYDSRLIATLISRSGYPNVQCFAYGAAKNRDAEFSRQIAARLNLPWLFVEYTESLWRQALGSDERRRFDIASSNWTSLPHYQDWLAVRLLLERNLVSKDAIFVPGHTGDFIAGGHLPEDIILSGICDENALFKFLFNAHFYLAPKSGVVHEQLRKNVLSHAKLEKSGDPAAFACACQCWEWQERQAKYIINSVRVYEEHGYNWWLPLWDAQFMAFWASVPLNMRLGRRWYIDQVQRLYSTTNVQEANSVLGNAGDGIWIRHPLLARVKASFPDEFVRKVASFRDRGQRFIALFRKPQDPLAFPTSLDDKTARRLLAKGYSANGVVAQSFLAEWMDQSDHVRADQLTAQTNNPEK